MQALENCPICGSLMVNNPRIIGDIYKKCSGAHENMFHCDYWKDNNNCITSINLHIEGEELMTRLTAYWNYGNNTFYINTGYRTKNLPWFEPNLSNYNALVQKVKTYILFS
jgi:hypothetical protein